MKFYNRPEPFPLRMECFYWCSREIVHRQLHEQDTSKQKIALGCFFAKLQKIHQKKEHMFV